MNKDQIIIDGKTFLSTRRGAEIAEYSADYVGQLCRAGKVECKMVKRVWFVEKESILEHSKRYANTATRANSTTFKPEDFKPQYSSVLSGGYPLQLTPSRGHVSAMQSSAVEYSVLQTTAKVARNAFIGFGVIALIIIFGISILSFSSNTKIGSTPSTNLVASVSSSIGSFFNSVFDFLTHSNRSDTIVTGNNSVSTSNGLLTDSSQPQSEHSGMVVVPSLGSTATNTSLANSITDKFSDPVEVKNLIDKNTGVITPVFRTVKGNEFMYVLVPVKDATSTVNSQFKQN